MCAAAPLALANQLPLPAIVYSAQTLLATAPFLVSFLANMPLTTVSIKAARSMDSDSSSRSERSRRKNCVTMPNFVEITQSTDEICQFSIFQDGGCRHLGFLKFQIFNGWNGQEGQTASACQVSSKSLEPRLRYNNFSIFPR